MQSKKNKGHRKMELKIWVQWRIQYFHLILKILVKIQSKVKEKRGLSQDLAHQGQDLIMKEEAGKTFESNLRLRMDVVKTV
jgi:hypothetical protein